METAISDSRGQRSHLVNAHAAAALRVSPLKMNSYKWQFTARFRRHSFGWRSDTPILRIKEALAEIKQVARTDGALAAEGAVLFLDKLSPALEQVDGSSGAPNS